MDKAVEVSKEGLKHDQGKLRFDLIPPEALIELAKVLTYGASKYNDRNWEFGMAYGRLYAVDVFPDATSESDRLIEVWNYSYFGKSQASPTLINDTLYFDGYNNSILRENRDPHIYAVYTNGTEKWKVSYPTQRRHLKALSRDLKP